MGKLPGINHLDAVRALEKAGFRIARQGKHVVMTDSTCLATQRGTFGPVLPGASWPIKLKSTAVPQE